MDQVWNPNVSNVDAWVAAFAARRYGAYMPEIQSAWLLLQNSVYNNKPTNEWNFGTPPSIIALRPVLQPYYSGAMFYDPYDVVLARDLLLSLSSNKTLASVDLYRYDIVEVSRQVLTNLAVTVHQSLLTGYNAGNITQVNQSATLILEIIKDMDSLVATRSEFLVGVWVEQAMSWGINPTEIQQYNVNARLQITLWGMFTSGLVDYAYKLWSGLIKDLYWARWSLFTTQLLNDMSNGQEFNETQYTLDVQQIEYAWTQLTNTYPVTPTGDSIQEALYIQQKYGSPK